MKWFICISLCICFTALSSNGHSQTSGPELASPPQIKTCESFDDFKKAYDFLKNEKALSLTESKNIALAIKISKGCTGSAQRFISVYETMKISGVALNKSISTAFEFAFKEDSRTQNFVNIFKRIFLENYFDFDFNTAFKVSYELSQNIETNVDEVRTDFVSLVQFCLDKNEVDLPLKTCAEMSLALCQNTKLFPKTGLFPSFKDLYQFLREHKRLGLSIREALKVIPIVLANGPRAPQNFKNAFDFSLSKDVNMNAKNSLQIAMLVAKNSLQKEVISDPKK